MADPREDPNGYLWEESTRWGADVLRVESYIAGLAIAEWAKTRSSAAVAAENALSRIRGRGARVLGQSNLRSLESRMAKIVGRGIKSVRKAITPELDELAVRTGRWSFDVWQRILPDVSFGPPRPSTVRAIWKRRMMTGRLIPEWYRKLTRDAQDAIRQAIRTGIVEGETTAQIVGRIARGRGSALGVAQRHVETFVRTATTHVNNSVNREVTNDLAKVAGVRKEVWRATLDTRTCPVCASLDGREYALGRGPVPPRHPNCKCLRTAVIPGAPAGERATMTGPVKGDTTFSDWLRRQPAKEQDRVLGSTRGRLFRAGKLGDLEAKYMIDPNGRPLPVRDLLSKLEREGKL